MELKAAIYYRNAYAHYIIKRENKGLYQADLILYDGPAEKAPAASVILIKAPCHWRGSTDDQELVNSLGNILTDTAFSDQFFIEKNNAADTVDE
jgi:hypothetical protein